MDQTDRISDIDLATLRALQAEARAAVAEAKTANAAVEGFLYKCAAFYGVGQGGTLSADGAITRAPTALTPVPHVCGPACPMHPTAETISHAELARRALALQPGDPAPHGADPKILTVEAEAHAEAPAT
jgi:hypothetical protein